MKLTTKKIKELIKKIWKFCEGNKSLFLSLVAILFESGAIPVTGVALNIIRGILILFGGESLRRHYKKGFFSTKDIVIKDD